MSPAEQGELIAWSTGSAALFIVVSLVVIWWRNR